MPAQAAWPANPGNKTDENDLSAQHRATVAGFGLSELELAAPYRDLQLHALIRQAKTNADIAQMIYDARIAAGLSQQALAELIDSSQQTIS